MLSKLNPRRVLAALAVIVAMLATSIGVAGAGVAPEENIRWPGGIDNDYYWDYNPLLPWEHNVVIVDIGYGSDAINRFDSDLAVPSLEEFASGHKPYLVDRIISNGPDGYGRSDPITGYGLGSVGSPDGGTYGYIANGLEQAGDFCNESYWLPCDIILITYQAPASTVHQRHAMAEAMKLAAAGYSLHTVAISPSDDVDVSDHYNFSALLGALGYHVVATVDEAPDVISEVIQNRYHLSSGHYFPEPVEPWSDKEDCWNCDAEWETEEDCWAYDEECEWEIDSDKPWSDDEDDCEVHEPDGNCYYGPSDAGGNLVDIGFVANHVSATNWISLVTAEDNAEIIELRYAVSDQDIDCDDAIPTPEVAPGLSILVDSDDVGQYYCLRVEFEDGDVQFLDHQLEARDLTSFDEEVCDDAQDDC